jgi:very-short-patch-repair endonuclease
MARLAERQYGVVSHSQLTALGYSEAAIARAVRSGRLHRVLRGAYAVGHAYVSPHGRCLAAVLACGSGALLSHHSSGWLWGLTGSCPTPPHVTVPMRGHRRPGVQLHHSTILEGQDVAEFEGIRTTSIPRTLLDIAGHRRGKGLDRLVEKAERLDQLDIDSLASLLARAGGHPGRGRLRRALDLYLDPAFVRARSERLFLDLVRQAGLPRPAMNIYIAEHEIDAYWEEERFAVEVDGWDTHRTRAAFERDPLRIEELKLAGIDAIRITARRIAREPDAVGERLRILLARRRSELRDRIPPPPKVRS